MGNLILQHILEGSKESGFFGHRGRPGIRGGSLPCLFKSPVKGKDIVF
jgi:hypothetical protein